MVLIGDVFKRIADLMYKAALVFGLRESCRNGFFDPGKTICADDKDILYSV